MSNQEFGEQIGSNLSTLSPWKHRVLSSRGDKTWKTVPSCTWFLLDFANEWTNETTWM